VRSSNLVRSRLPTSDEISQPLLAYARCWHRSRGGAAGIRTPDLRRARAALSRLSYGPPSRCPRPPPPSGVGAPGLEPGTSALSGPRSNHLSYAPVRPRPADRPRPPAGHDRLLARRGGLGPRPPPVAQDGARGLIAHAHNTAPQIRRHDVAALPGRGSAPARSRPCRQGRTSGLGAYRGHGLRQTRSAGSSPGDLTRSEAAPVCTDVTAPLPRKEVIQPQLPLRLPCYDFVPITSPALDGCLPKGLAHRLQALPAFVT
jgi:hypothetical protein